ncbi:MAG TPA: hypothetical protein VI874_03660, partial [Candidatus Norongarragalinales archaeon]|nr:hypothetical protein [Candidatus Norongarragalinales archaeon]
IRPQKYETKFPAFVSLPVFCSDCFPNFILAGGTGEIIWNHDPTFIPTHSALDFDETLERAGHGFFRYKNATGPFDRVYLNPQKKSEEHFALAVHVDSLLNEVFSSFNGTCILPAAGDWTLKHDCTLYGAASVPGNVIVQEQVALTLAEGASLNMDFSTHHLRIKKGSKVVIKKGAKIH